MVAALTVPGVIDCTNCPLLCPAGTVTDAGTTKAELLLLDRLTEAPPLGAAPLNVTTIVSDAAVPLITVLGVIVTPVTVGSATVTEKVTGPVLVWGFQTFTV